MRPAAIAPLDAKIDSALAIATYTNVFIVGSFAEFGCSDACGARSRTHAHGTHAHGTYAHVLRDAFVARFRGCSSTWPRAGAFHGRKCLVCARRFISPRRPHSSNRPLRHTFRGDLRLPCGPCARDVERVVGGLAEEMVTHRAATYAGHSEGAGAKPAELSSDSRPSFRKMAKA